MNSKSYSNFKKFLRENQTTPENILWYHLRNRTLQGLKFRRQVQFETYIVDFVCFEKKLIIEIDGGQHNEDKHIYKDQVRDIFFTNNGYKILRFWNNEVLNNIEGVLETILTTV